MNFPIPNQGGPWFVWAVQLIQSLQPTISKTNRGYNSGFK